MSRRASTALDPVAAPVRRRAAHFALVRPALVAAVTTAAARRVLEAAPPGGAGRWRRTNHAGHDVTLLEGPAVVAGLVAGTLAASPVHGWSRVTVASALAAVGAVGAYDDLRGASATKGLRGHLDALRGRQLSSGTVKVLGIGACGLVSATALRRSLDRTVWHPATALDALLVAASANLVNLLDLRPGRALKGALLASAGLLSRSGAALAAPVTGAALGAARGDLAGRSMLGDCGANALGAAAGGVAVVAVPAPQRTALLAAVVGLTLASERVSFSAVIDSSPLLRRVDALGRPHQ